MNCASTNLYMCALVYVCVFDNFFLWILHQINVKKRKQKERRNEYRPRNSKFEDMNSYTRQKHRWMDLFCFFFFLVPTFFLSNHLSHSRTHSNQMMDSNPYTQVHTAHTNKFKNALSCAAFLFLGSFLFSVLRSSSYARFNAKAFGIFLYSSLSFSLVFFSLLLLLLSLSM